MNTCTLLSWPAFQFVPVCWLLWLQAHPPLPGYESLKSSRGDPGPASLLCVLSLGKLMNVQFQSHPCENDMTSYL